MNDHRILFRESIRELFRSAIRPQTRILTVLCALAAVLAGFSAREARARMLDCKEIERAAVNFLAGDVLATRLLSERSVSGLEAKGPLWLVRLAPTGHILMAGSDRAEPIVGFSPKDYAEPDAGSPAAALLAAKAAAVEVCEADTAALRKSRWDELLAAGHRGGARSGAVEVPDTAVCVAPFLESHYDQCQPYNDYAPVWNAGNREGTYRGRDPTGCVPASAAQMLRHFRWPAFAGDTRQVGHEWYDQDPVETFTIRFDGRVPFDWTALDDEYPRYTVEGRKVRYDLRGSLPEAERYSVARLFLWAESLAEVEYFSDGSASAYSTVAENLLPWYWPGEWLDADSADLSPVVADLVRGIPVQVELSEHEVIGHGWAESGDERYIYLDFGWGGASDGYYNLAEDATDMAFDRILVGHYPRAKPQIDQMPAVTGTSPALSWHFPDFHADALSGGFRISVSSPSTEAESLEENFTDPDGTVGGEGVGFGTDTAAGQGAVLEMLPYSNGSYAFATSAFLMSSSQLSFKIRSRYALNGKFRAEMRFDGGAWETVAEPALSTTGDSGWTTVSVSLGDHAGRTVQLRFVNEYQWGTYYPSGKISVDDVRLANVLAYREVRQVDVSSDARSTELAGLAPGTPYAATILPLLAGEALAPAEASDPVMWWVEGTPVVPAAWGQSERTVLGLPAVVSVLDADGNALPEGFYRECARGRARFFVECTPSVVSLRALPSHLSLLSDAAVTVHPAGTGRFAVELDASGMPASADGSRMILTLEATDANGTTACKDLSLRFSSETAADPEWDGTTPWVEITEQWVAFDPNGGTCGTTSNAYGVGEAYGALPTPEWPGYTWLGWFTAPEGGEHVTEASEVTEEAERTLYAHWAIANQTVHFDANGGSCSKTSVVCVIGGAYSSFATASWANHKFLGWYDAREGGTRVRVGMEVTSAPERTLYAHWEAAKQTVHFDANGGTCSKASVVCVIGETYSSFAKASWGSRKFLGWYDAREGGTRVRVGMEVTSASERTLYAHWEVAKQTVHFDANGGTCSKASVVCVIGETYSSFAKASWGSRKFLGWYDAREGGTRVRVGMEVTAVSERTLYAHWEVAKQMVHFDANGGTSSKASVVCVIGGTYSSFAKASWGSRKFLGWYDAREGGTRVRVGMEVPAASERTLYAHWEVAQQTVHFDANAGACTKTSAKYPIGETYTGFKIPTRDGFKFLGWYTAVDGGKRVKNGMTVTDDAERTLYAHWEATAGTLSITGFSRSLSSGMAARDARAAADEYMLRFVAVAGAVYEVLWAPSLDAEWTVLKTWIADADGDATVPVAVPADSPTGFFRVLGLDDE